MKLIEKKAGTLKKAGGDYAKFLFITILLQIYLLTLGYTDGK